jgi:hypothetical protein
MNLQYINVSMRECALEELNEFHEFYVSTTSPRFCSIDTMALIFPALEKRRDVVVKLITIRVYTVLCREALTDIRVYTVLCREALTEISVQGLCVH